MNRTAHTQRNRSRRAGDRSPAFTLVELLVVLGIMAVLIALSLPALGPVLRASRLAASGNQVMDQLNLARQNAQSRNAVVEVRFYQLPDFGQNPATSGKTTWRAMQAFLINGNTLTALGKPEFFAEPVEFFISATGIESPLFSSASFTTQTAAATDVKLGIYGVNYNYRAFHFNPSGSTDLPSGENHFTLVLKSDKTPQAGGNFVTIQVDNESGSVRKFRP